GCGSWTGAEFAACTQLLAGSHKSVVQASLSLQSRAGPPTHAPSLHRSGVVHASPSSQGSVLNPVTTHTPAASQPSAFSVQMLPSLHAAPAASNVHVAVQQSPGMSAPGSHSSPRLAATKPSPQYVAGRPIGENWSVMVTPPGMPGPSTLNTFVPHEPPVTACRIAGLPMYPAGADDGGSHVRKWLMRAVVSSVRSASTLVNRSPVAMAHE